MKRLMILTMCVIFVISASSIASAGVGSNSGENKLRGQARAIEAHTLNRGFAKAHGIKVEELPTGEIVKVDGYGRVTSLVSEPTAEPYVSYSINVVYPDDPAVTTCTVTFMHEYLASPVTLQMSYTAPDDPTGEWTIGSKNSTGIPAADYLWLKWTYIDGNPKPYFTMIYLFSWWDGMASKWFHEAGGTVGEQYWDYLYHYLLINGTWIRMTQGSAVRQWDGRRLLSERYVLGDECGIPQVRYKMVYTYDAAGNRVSGEYIEYDMTVPYPFPEVKVGDIVYTYDQTGLLLKDEIISVETGLSLATTIYEYDEAQNLTGAYSETILDLGQQPRT